MQTYTWMFAGSRVKSNKTYFSQRRQKSKADEARELMSNLVFSHVPVVHFDFQQKVVHCNLQCFAKAYNTAIQGDKICTAQIIGRSVDLRICL